jgi:hypothetical protein
VRETLYRAANWRITETTHTHEKKNANTVDFKLTVPKDKEQVIRYTVEYTR